MNLALNTVHVGDCRALLARVMLELNPEYAAMARRRMSQQGLLGRVPSADATSARPTPISDLEDAVPEASSGGPHVGTQPSARPEGNETIQTPSQVRRDPGDGTPVPDTAGAPQGRVQFPLADRVLVRREAGSTPVHGLGETIGPGGPPVNAAAESAVGVFFQIATADSGGPGPDEPAEASVRRQGDVAEGGHNVGPPEFRDAATGTVESYDGDRSAEGGLSASPSKSAPSDSEAASASTITGQFTSFGEWVNKARSWIGGTGAVCTDTKGRVLLCGADFQRARDEGAFPVTFTYDPDKRRRPRTKRGVAGGPGTARAAAPAPNGDAP